MFCHSSNSWRFNYSAFQHIPMLSGSVSGQLGGGQSKLQPLLATYGVFPVVTSIVIACHMIVVQGGYQYVCYFIATVCLTNLSIAYFFVPTELSESKKKSETSKKEKTLKNEDTRDAAISSVLKAFTGVSGPMSDLLALKFVLEFALFSHICNFAPVLWEVYNTAPGWIGYTLGLFILAGVLARPLAARILKLQIKDQETLALYGFGIYTASFACLFLAPSWIWIIVSMVPLHISNAMLTSIVSDLEKQRKASTGASAKLVVASARITAPFMSGLMYDNYGYPGASFLRVLVSGTGILIASSLSKKQIQGKKEKDSKKVK
ncbi:hypothetical protein C0J52_07331 [Blattella germanica]|nr:hypothetical protein C0J52_07331 [Blattella germanica]